MFLNEEECVRKIILGTEFYFKSHTDYLFSRVSESLYKQSHLIYLFGRLKFVFVSSLIFLEGYTYVWMKFCDIFYNFFENISYIISGKGHLLLLASLVV